MGYRATWKGNIAIGIVQVPVKVIKATEDNETVKFNWLHNACHGQVRQRKFCPECDIDLSTADIINGFNLDGEIIPLTEEDLESLPISSSKSLEIYSLGEKPDPIRINTNYFVVPDKGGEYVFSVIIKALMSNKKNSALNTMITMRGRERPCSIWLGEDTVVLSTLRLSDEIRHIPMEISPKVKKEEVEVTNQLLTMLSKELPTEDRYKQAIIDIATQKRDQGDNWKPKTQKKSVSVEASDLMEALRQSMAQAATSRN